MLPSFCNDTVTVERAPLINSRGTTVPDWSNPTQKSLAGCSVQPVSSVTSWNDVRQASTVRAVLYAPPNADIKSGDRITFNSAQYSIDGAPMPWKSPTGRVSHVQCSLVDWVG